MLVSKFRRRPNGTRPTIAVALWAMTVVSCGGKASVGSNGQPAVGSGGSSTITDASGSGGDGGSRTDGSESAGSGGRDFSMDGSVPTAALPHAYYYANPVDYGHVYAVPKGASTPIVLATGKDPDNIGSAFTFDGGHVYYNDAVWVSPSFQARLVALPTSGAGTPTTLVTGLHSVKGLAVDATSLYFIDVGSIDMPYVTIVGKVSLNSVSSADAGAFEKLSEDSEGGGTAIAIDGGYVYWTEQAQAGGFVKRVPIAGGAVETLATNQTLPTAVAVDSTGTYWLDEGHPGVDCAATDGSLNYLAPGSSSPMVLASNLAGAGSIAVKGGTLYFTTRGQACNGSGGGGSISTWLSPSGPVRTFASNLTEPNNLVIDSTDLYFTIVADEYSYTMAATFLPR